MTQGTGDEFGIVPVLGVKLMGQSFNRGFIATLVLELEIITAAAVFHPVLNDQAFVDQSWQHNPFIIIGKPGEYFIRFAIDQADKGDPFLPVVLETNDVCFQYFRAGSREDAGIYALIRIRIVGLSLFFFFLFFVCSDQYTATAAIPVNGNAFTAAFPSLEIQFTHQFFGNIIGHIDGHADAMVYPFLNSTLHTHFSMIIYIIGSSFIIRRLCHKVIELFLVVVSICIMTVDFHPFFEIMVEYNVFFPAIAYFIYKIYTDVFIIGVNLTAALIHRQEHRFDTTGGLRHQRSSTGRSDR